MKKSEVRSVSVRNHHYWFSQKYLYELVNFSLELSFKRLMNNEFNWALEDMWEHAYNSVKELEPGIQKIESNGFPSITVKIDDSSFIFIVTMPEPQAMTESYFVGIYFHFNGKKFEMRYFLNEYHNEKYSSICEKRETRHINYGANKILSAEEFTDEIINILKIKKPGEQE